MNNIKVNFKFIAALEGGPQLTGYVPDAKHSNSGVTIATGFDIGQCDEAALKYLLPDFIAIKLKRFCLLKGEQALKACKQDPLNINENEATIIDLCVKQQSTNYLVATYNQHSTVEFEQLSEPMQTVIASVAFQYGHLAKRCPNFWRYAITQNTQAMIRELVDFGDRYTTRRWREASYLKQAGH